MAEPERRAQVLTGLLDQVAEPLRSELLEEAIRAVRELDGRSLQRRSKIYKSLGPHVRDEILREFLEAAIRSTSELQIADELAALAPSLSEELLCESFQSILSLGSTRSSALKAIAPYLPERELRHALALVSNSHRGGTGDGGQNDDVRGKLIQRLYAIGHLEEALALAKGISEERIRARVLIGMASGSPEPDRVRILEEAAAAARDIRWSGPFKAQTLLEAAQSARDPLRSRLQEEAVTQARSLPVVRDRLEVMSSASSFLDSKAIRDLLIEVCDAEKGHELMDAFAFHGIMKNLAPHLTNELVAEALYRVRELPERYGISRPRSSGLAPLATRLAGLGQIEKAIDLVSSGEVDFYRREVLEGIAAVADDRHIAGIVSQIQKIGDDGARAIALVSLSSALPGSAKEKVLDEAVNALAQVEDDVRTAEVIVSMAPNVGGERTPRLLDIAKRLGGSSAAKGVSAVAPYLDSPQQMEEVDSALAGALRLELDAERAWALVALSSCLEVRHLNEALKAAFTIDRGTSPTDSFHRGQALASLLPRVAELGYAKEALDIVRDASEMPHVRSLTLGSGEVRRDEDAEVRTQGMIMQWVPEALRGMVPHFNEEALASAVRLAQSVRHDHTRVAMLASLSPHLPSSMLDDIVDDIEQLPDGRRPTALLSLAPHLEEASLRRALRAAEGVENEGGRNEALAGMLPHLARLGHPEDAIAYARKIGDSTARLRAVIGIATYVDDRSIDSLVVGLADDLLKDGDLNAQDVALISPHLASLDSSPDRHERILRGLANSKREGLLSGIAALVPLTVHVSGSEGVEAIVAAIRDAARWWP